MYYTPWIAPTETERLLYEATARGDWDGQIAALAAGELYVAVPRAEADGLVPPTPPAPYRDPATGRPCLPVVTRGGLPPWQPDWVFERMTLAELAGVWPDDRWRLAVNPGTPGAAVIEATPLDREAWLEVCAETPRAGAGRLVGLMTGPLHGPLARGLACGAPSAVRDGVPWNELGAVHRDYQQDRAELWETWGVNDPVSWRQLTERLLSGAGAGREAEFALRAREGLSEHASGKAPTAEEWRDAVRRVLLHRAASDGDTEAFTSAVDRILACEERLRADAVLPPGGRVASAAAFDHGCAVLLARLGLAARLCAPADAEYLVVSAGERARAAYGSWQEFAAGFLLGLALRERERNDPRGGQRDARYASALAAHRVLTADAASPWANIPWT
ncbi:DUF1266 domain-containing protein [Streptomyces gamaensis]|uniref:DUF1266 domain-containing protein n=1 Tax=Streptomyces gamaensis TaxID=1763542 RepID=A0ABW0YUY0_9ACTN